MEFLFYFYFLGPWAPNDCFKGELNIPGFYYDLRSERRDIIICYCGCLKTVS
jgi:hypothetical protein